MSEAISLIVNLFKIKDLSMVSSPCVPLGRQGTDTTIYCLYLLFGVWNCITSLIVLFFVATKN
ncbi:MAG TPA: hypothetical protein VJ455_01685 [Ignavibacteria bacterium]|nr:hypothetical protein [Ignavibacteria bacterium]